MKFVHISDLHIGKRLSEFPIVDDQRYILERIVDIVREESPDGVLIAGDVYDNTTPSSESVQILDDFLTALSDTGSKIFMISGNHDSPEKIGYGSALFRRNGIHIAGRFDGSISPIRIDDKDGRSAEVFLIPFIRPFVVKRRFPDADIKDYTDAMRAILENSPSMGLDFKVAVAHQFVTSSHGDPSTCESEDPRIGDVDSMDVSVFDSFDYVALGHLHTPQHVGRETVRYCGTPLKYSASEVSMDKTVTVIEMDDEIRIREVPLVPLRDVRKVKGRLEDIIDAAKSEPNRDDLIYVELTEETVNAMERIRQVYPNTLHIKVIRPDNSGYALPDIDDIRALDPMEVFEEMYKRSRGEEMTDEQRRIVRGMMEDSGVRF
ncbi:MAG: exonuclease SbcCD subunit D [Candidatus Methanomethylophilaceae archaeon]|nr:exonuclease SbcCD subunit D [Candidatus Methanomethylophilaceae archaeon]